MDEVIHKFLYDTLVDIAGFSLLQTCNYGISWEKNWDTVYRKRRKANGSDLEVTLAVDCSREVDICH